MFTGRRCSSNGMQLGTENVISDIGIPNSSDPVFKSSMAFYQGLIANCLLNITIVIHVAIRSFRTIRFLSKKVNRLEPIGNPINGALIV